MHSRLRRWKGSGCRVYAWKTGCKSSAIVAHIRHIVTDALAPLGGVGPPPACSFSSSQILSFSSHTAKSISSLAVIRAIKVGNMEAVEEDHPEFQRETDTSPYQPSLGFPLFFTFHTSCPSSLRLLPADPGPVPAMKAVYLHNDLTSSHNYTKSNPYTTSFFITQYGSASLVKFLLIHLHEIN